MPLVTSAEKTTTRIIRASREKEPWSTGLWSLGHTPPADRVETLAIRSVERGAGINRLELLWTYQYRPVGNRMALLDLIRCGRERFPSRLEHLNILYAELVRPCGIIGPRLDPCST